MRPAGGGGSSHLLGNIIFPGKLASFGREKGVGHYFGGGVCLHMRCRICVPGERRRGGHKKWEYIAIWLNLNGKNKIRHKYHFGGGKEIRHSFVFETKQATKFARRARWRMCGAIKGPDYGGGGEELIRECSRATGWRGREGGGSRTTVTPSFLIDTGLGVRSKFYESLNLFIERIFILKPRTDKNAQTNSIKNLREKIEGCGSRTTVPEDSLYIRTGLF